MEVKLKKTFLAYTSIVRSQLQEQKSLKVRKRLVYLNQTMKLKATVGELEGTAEFHQLVEETRSQYYGAYHKGTKSFWEHAVQNFFRRSEYYKTVFEGQAQDEEEVFVKYRAAFEEEEIKISYFIPMEGVRFEQRSMSFGAFEVRRFTAEELATIFQNNINELFYGTAIVDVHRLKDYWFIHLTELVSAPKLGFIYPDWNWQRVWLGRVDVRYTKYNKTIECVLQQLALYDWQAEFWKKEFSLQDQGRHKEDPERGWLGFNVPFAIRRDSNLLDFPISAPDLLGLQTEPVMDNAGEEIGEVPQTWIRLDESETENFRAFMSRMGLILAALRGVNKTDWLFLDVALGYFVKAFFSEDLEQLLWHITSLEALLGKRGHGVEERLAPRIAALLGRTEDERKVIKKHFLDLYEFRSDLVHGRPFQKKEVYLGNLRHARDLARRTLIWFLNFLKHIQTEEYIPTRTDILALLDLDEDSRMCLGRLINNVPSAFPHVPEWLE